VQQRAAVSDNQRQQSCASRMTPEYCMRCHGVCWMRHRSLAVGCGRGQRGALRCIAKNFDSTQTARSRGLVPPRRPSSSVSGRGGTAPTPPGPQFFRHFNSYNCYQAHIRYTFTVETTLGYTRLINPDAFGAMLEAWLNIGSIGQRLADAPVTRAICDRGTTCPAGM
jgi:hypothetical protein